MSDQSIGDEAQIRRITDPIARAALMTQAERLARIEAHPVTTEQTEIVGPTPMVATLLVLGGFAWLRWCDTERIDRDDDSGAA